MLLAVACVAFAIGFLTRRGYGVVLASALFALWMALVFTWGPPMSDGWQYGLAVLALLVVGGSSLGVATAHLHEAWRGRRRATPPRLTQ